MREHYERWWARVLPRLNEFGRITVGSDAENPSLLSPCEWQDVFLDQSRQVRVGEAKNGAWNIWVDRDGDYEISLRRWPVETDAAISAGLPPFQGVDGQFPAGKALPISKARLKIADLDQSQAVAKGDKASTFALRLKAGPTRLQTWFTDADGKELCGAYYVYVRKN